jgi:hypothetical protein
MPPIGAAGRKGAAPQPIAAVVDIVVVGIDADESEPAMMAKVVELEVTWIRE